MKILQDLDPCLATIEDFKKYYVDTYIVVRHPSLPPQHGLSTLAYVCSAGQDFIKLKTVGEVIAPITIGVTDKQAELERYVPAAGYFNFGKGAFYLSRPPLRQWKKGVSESNVEIVLPYYDYAFQLYQSNLQFQKSLLNYTTEVQKIHKSPKSAFGMFVLQAMQTDFQPKVSILQATESMQLSGAVSRALNHTWAISVCGIQDAILLWRDQNIVGVVNYNKHLIIPTHTVHKQEIQDFMFRHLQDKKFKLTDYIYGEAI